MYKLQILFLFLVLCFSTVAQDNYISDNLEKVWETPENLKICESVCYDADQNILFVSCINGNPTEKDGNGYISVVSLDGDIQNEKWISDLNAPKGMGIFNKTLYVTDIDNIVEIDINTGIIKNRFPVEGAKFLNDITIAPNGDIYFSDMSTNIIHKLSEGKVSKFLEDPEILKPNGIFYENGDIIIGTKTGIFAVRITDGKTWHIIKNTGGIDGIEADGNGNYIISDWAGKIQLVNTEKDPIVLLNTSANMNAADIEYIQKLNLLFVPTFGANKVVAYRFLMEE